CKDLIEYGPMKPEVEQGYTEDEIETMGQTETKKEILKERKFIAGREVLINRDPTGRRTGEAVVEELAEVLIKTMSNAEAITSKDNTKFGELLTKEKLIESFENIKGAVTILYPMGLPIWETVREILENNEDLTGTAASKEVLTMKETALWWASKEFMLEKTLSDYIGKNEKTNIILKVTKRGQGPPLKEPPMTEEAQKNLMAYYFRKQEEHKKLLENKEDDYVDSTWANPKSLKSAFSGINGQHIKWSPR
ncbi:hypothetical protein HK096_000432, partial [Nowakowskiella sp. JEL0078]